MVLCLKNISNNVFGIISSWVMKINDTVTRDIDGGTGNTVVGGTCTSSEVVQCNLTDMGWLQICTQNSRKTTKGVPFC